MNKTENQVMNLLELKKTVMNEIRARQYKYNKNKFANVKQESHSLYGLTGAVNIYQILGESIGSFYQRKKIAKTILSYQRRDGTFSDSEPEHAMCMAIQALNILGYPIPNNVAPLAPVEINKFYEWIECHDWDSTHKKLWGGLIPIFSSDRIDNYYIEAVTNYFDNILSENSLGETWCSSDAPAWKVISSIYHILPIYDSAAIEYPKPELLINRLLNLKWNERRKSEMQTICTDGDWAWMLIELSKILPEYFVEVMQQIKDVSYQRVLEWNRGTINLNELSTHHIYCYMWVTAQFQHLVRDHYIGPWLHDTLNSPELFRLNKR